MQVTGNNIGKYIKVEKGKWTLLASNVKDGIITKDDANIAIRAALVVPQSGEPQHLKPSILLESQTFIAIASVADIYAMIEPNDPATETNVTVIA